MFKYLFQLGHQPQISTAEIEAVLSLYEHTNIRTCKHLNNNYLTIDLKKEIDCEKLINQLGGTIKIARSLQLTANSLQEKITVYLNENQPTGKIEFSLGDQKLGLRIKKELKNLGRSVRYIEPKNTATILHNKLIEKKSDFTIIDNEIYITEAIQPFEEMAERDYQRPGVDDKSGMLPPKLAKIMINLAVSGVETRHASSLQDDITILDPFCGSGTVLTEALVMGRTNLIGSDISEKAIEDTRKNIDWLTKTCNLPAVSCKLFVADASELSNNLKPSSVDAIVTEPYLGKPLHGNESESYIKKQTEELKQLYLNAFKEFYKILKPDGSVVFIIPRFYFGKDEIIIDIENEIAKIGFEIMPFVVETRHASSLLYHRPNQHLAREIWRFKKLA